MFRRSMFGISAVLVVGVLALVPGTATPQEAQRVTIQFFDKNGDDFIRRVNEGSKRSGPGDWQVFKSAIFDPETCEGLGHIVGRVVFVQPARGWFMADGAALLADGKVDFHFVGNGSEFETGAKAAVMGGTGAYKDATGETTTVQERRCDAGGFLRTLDLSVSP